jgi:hypothetical protein
MPHLRTRLIRGNRVSLAVHRQTLKTIFDSALLLRNRAKLFLTTKFAKDTKGSGYFLDRKLRALRMLRGQISVSLLVAGFAALGLRKFSQRSLSAMRHSTKLFLTTKFAKDTKGPDIFGS